jgi:superfamily II DNA/RNA helicase
MCTDIQEYLLLKGVEAVSIHGSKSAWLALGFTNAGTHPRTAQEEREYAIKSFKSGKKDVMVASGVASKVRTQPGLSPPRLMRRAQGLDFSEIQHVINFTMPREVEVRSSHWDCRKAPLPSGAQDYVHQIGRTGRSGKTGIATTFVNMQTQEQTLLDLKYLLMEAKQRCRRLARRQMADAKPTIAESRPSSHRSRTRTAAIRGRARIAAASATRSPSARSCCRVNKRRSGISGDGARRAVATERCCAPLVVHHCASARTDPEADDAPFSHCTSLGAGTL